MGIWEIIIASGVPTAITGFFFWILKRQIDKQSEERKKIAAEQEAKQLEREQNREKFNLMLAQSTRAAVVLSEATARAVQRIPDAHCNGDMTAALDFAEKVQLQQKDFLLELGHHALYD